MLCFSIFRLLFAAFICEIKYILTNDSHVEYVEYHLYRSTATWPERRANSHKPSPRWWHHPVGHFGVKLQELVDRLDRVSRKYSLLINVDNTKVMASVGIACLILIHNEQLEQMDTFPCLGSMITEDGNCRTEFRTKLNRSHVIGALMQKIWKSHNIPISRKIRLIKALVWPVVRLWKLDTQKE